MWYEWEIILELSEKDIWKNITYIDVFKWCETWKIKSFNNDLKIAYVVFKCNNDWNNFKNYTAEACNYNSLAF